MRASVLAMMVLLFLAAPGFAVDLWMDVDAALSEVPVNIFPLTDDTDFKSREESVAYNASGLELIWHFTTTAGATSATVVTPTTGGDYDWAHQDGGMYTIEIPASAGASINNDTEGFGWFTGVATGVLPWRGPVIGFRAAAMNNVVIDNGTAQGVAEDLLDGTKVSVGDIFSDAGTVDDIPTANENAAAVLAAIIDGSISLQDTMQILLSTHAGKAAVTDNGATRTINFYLQDGSTVKLSITAAESDGARSAGGTIN